MKGCAPEEEADRMVRRQDPGPHFHTRTGVTADHPRLSALKGGSTQDMHPRNLTWPACAFGKQLFLWEIWSEEPECFRFAVTRSFLCRDLNNLNASNKSILQLQPRESTLIDRNSIKTKTNRYTHPNRPVSHLHSSDRSVVGLQLFGPPRCSVARSMI